MNCADFQVLAPDVLSGELTDAKSLAEAHHHRASCRDCDRYLQDVGTITAALRGAAGGPAAPAELWARIHSELDSVPAPAPLPEAEPIRPARLGRLAAAAACALVAAAAAVLFFRTSPDSQRPEPSADSRIRFERISWAAPEGSDSVVDPLSHMILSSADPDDQE